MKIKNLIAAFFCLVTLGLFAQQPKKYDKTFLENQNKQLRKEIAELNTLLAKSKSESQSTFLYVFNLQKKIATREKLVNNSVKEKKFIEDDIYLKQLEVNKLTRELADLKKSYGEVLVKSYKSKSVQNKILFVLSAKDFSQTIRRLKYLQLYADYQDNKSEEIKSKLNTIEVVKRQKEKSIQEKNFVLAQQKVELDKLDKERIEKDKVVQNYKKQQGNFLAQINAKQAQTNKNAALISKIINEEIAAAKKAADEEKKRNAVLLAAKAKADKEAKDKADRELREQRERERLAKIAADKEADAKKKAAAIALAKIEEDKTKIAVKKVDVAEKAVAAPTKTTADVISGNFEANKGSLPKPVDGGTVYMAFGRNPHPLDPTNIFDNPGIDFAVQKNSKAKVVFEGTVVRVFETDGLKNIMVNHGEYYTTYSFLDDVYVKKGDKIKKGEPIGHIYTNNQGDTILKFTLYKGNSRQNPSVWLN